jgi:broad specificity phosphatase PhoE
MKWPNQLTLIRHDVSAFNAMKKVKEADPRHRRMRELYERHDLSESEYRELRECAQHIQNRYGLKTVGDWNTPLADASSPLGKTVGDRLAGDCTIALPDVIMVSPYVRTLDTLKGLCAGWLALKQVKVVVEERLREQEHGLAILYNDWRAFQALHPEQRLLREAEGRYWYRYPQGENVADVRERMRSFMGTLTRDFAGMNVLCVMHHLAILAFRANMERWDADEFIRVDEQEKPINCGVTVYDGNPKLGRDGRLVLRKYNMKFYET